MTQTSFIPEETSILTCGNLHRILREAALFAHKGDDLPMLNSVHLESTGKHLIAVGTNRFVLGASACPWDGPEFSALIPLERISLILAMLPGGRKHHFTHEWSVRLRFTPKRSRLHLVAPECSLSIPLRSSDMDFVQWKHLVHRPEGESVTTPAVFGANPNYLALFGRVGGRDDRPVWHLRNPNKPIGVSVGPWFHGIIMPTRVAEGFAIPEWIPHAAG